MYRSSGALVVALVASLLVCSLLGPAGAVGTAAAQDGDAGTAGLPAMAQGFEADRVEFRITVYENGSATWLFHYEQGLDSEAERSDFETFAAEFEGNETDLYEDFRSRAVALTDSGENETGREMSAENFRRSAGVAGPTDNLGVVDMSFRWDGFARVDDGVVVGDVFEGGLYVGPDQRLVVSPGPDLAFADVQPDDGELSDETLADSDTVTWSGEHSFNPSRPRVEFVDVAAAPSDPSQDSTPVEGDTGWMLPVGAFVVVLLVGLGVGVAYRSGALPPTGDGSTASEAGSVGAAAGTSTTDDGSAEAATTTAVPDEELVSDEERVVSLLDDSGGRMKQVNIVEETGWSKSKVSMLLSEMEDEETISKLRVGRENIVSLAGHEPDAAGSPFDEDE